MSILKEGFPFIIPGFLGGAVFFIATYPRIKILQVFLLSCLNLIVLSCTAKSGFTHIENTAPEGFVFIQGGTFLMGSPQNERGHSIYETQNSVTVDSFCIGIYEVTQKEYEEVMGTNPSFFKGSNLPVEQVSWFDAILYCNKRSKMEGLTPVYTTNGLEDQIFGEYLKRMGDEAVVIWNTDANGYRLPTEEEWEYAARGGNKLQNYFIYAGSNSPGKVAWYKWNSRGRTHEVGKKKPNDLGIYDMSGNVYELVYYSYNTVNEGPFSGLYAIYKGGSWSSGKDDLRSAYSFPVNAYNKNLNDVGFRLARNATSLNIVYGDKNHEICRLPAQEKNY